MTVRDIEIAQRQLCLAVRDYGGAGDAIMLLHGASRTSVDWDLAGPLMTQRHRVVSLDFRCHGRSTDGPWGWEEVCDDVLLAISELQLGPTTVVGHSLGGMVAALLAQQPGAVVAAVNLDGHGFGTPDLYQGLTEQEAREGLDRLQMLIATAPQPEALTDDEVEQLRAATGDAATARGLPAEWAQSAMWRGLTSVSGGVWTPRPTASAWEEILEATNRLDLLGTYRGAAVPLLVVQASDVADPSLPAWAQDLLHAYHAGLRSALQALQALHPRFTTATTGGGHMLNIEQPAEVASLVLGFLSRMHAGG